jgi:hypothetical protein
VIIKIDINDIIDVHEYFYKNGSTHLVRDYKFYRHKDLSCNVCNIEIRKNYITINDSYFGFFRKKQILKDLGYFPNCFSYRFWVDSNNKYYNTPTAIELEMKRIDICKSCAPTKIEATKLILDFLMDKFCCDKGKNMNNDLKTVLEKEKIRLHEQFGKLDKLSKKEIAYPQHIKDHMNFRMSLITNCIKTLNELEENNEVEESLKEIFS